MATPNKALVLRQLDDRLAGLAYLKDLSRPRRGWLRAIRAALGMSGAQLGERLGVTRARIARIEKDEVGDKLTLETLRRTAEALDCVFVYAIVPRTSLADTVQAQARAVARARAERTGRTMRLEDQALSEAEARTAMDAEADRLVREMPRTLWDRLA